MSCQWIDERIEQVKLSGGRISPRVAIGYLMDAQSLSEKDLAELGKVDQRFVKTFMSGGRYTVKTYVADEDLPEISSRPSKYLTSKDLDSFAERILSHYGYDVTYFHSYSGVRMTEPVPEDIYTHYCGNIHWDEIRALTDTQLRKVHKAMSRVLKELTRTSGRQMRESMYEIENLIRDLANMENEMEERKQRLSQF